MTESSGQPDSRADPAPTRPGSIAGVVHDASGTPVEGAVVLFAAPSPPHRDIAAMTGSSGAFAMANLVPGSYTVVVNAPSYQGGQEVVEVEGGRAASIVITLQRNDSAGS